MSAKNWQVYFQCHGCSRDFMMEKSDSKPEECECGEMAVWKRINTLSEKTVERR